MKNLKIIFSAIILILPVMVFSQQNKIDSLKTLIKNEKSDTNKVIHSYKLCEEYGNTGHYDAAIQYGNTALQLALQLNFKKGIANSYANIGIIYYHQADYFKTLEYWLKALKIDEELENKKGIASLKGNIGLIYLNQADYPKAIDYFIKALKSHEELGNKTGTAATLNNIGNIYLFQSDYSKAIDYYFKALKLDEELENKNGITHILSCLGRAYQAKLDYPKALEYYLKALKMDKELGNKEGIATNIGNIGSIYEAQNNYSEASDYYFKALKLDEELGNKNNIAGWLGNIGILYIKKGKFKEAEQYLKKSIIIFDSIDAMDKLRQCEDAISELYDTTKQYKLALIHYKKAATLKDTLFSQENKKQLVRKEMNYEFDKKEAVTKAITEEKSRRQQFVTWSIAGGLLLVAVFAAFVFRSLRVTKRQNIIIEKQKKIVEEHQKEIVASITYAKRLQDAILPPIASIKNNFPESFVLYAPKDVVAGDFYWMETIDNISFIAAADCTGHGVPGAMMSVVCSSALNRAVKEFGLRDTGKILDKVTDLVLETFEKSGTDVKDGMDISILAYNKTNNSKQWSGANNPLWYTQNNSIIEIKPNKQPIGQCDHRKPFTTHDITCEKNAVFYLFTDGYADQFGGAKGKKFMYRKLQENLLRIHTLPLNQQQEALKSGFDVWKGSLEQVDDVTIIGIMI